MGNRLLRAAPWVTTGGTVVQLLGLAVDARLHRLDPGLGAHEGIFTMANPGHALIALGVALMVAGTVFFLGGQAGSRPGVRLLGRLTGPVSAAALVAFALVAFTFALSTGTLEHEHATVLAPTADQLATAADFLKATKAGTARFADYQIARAEGYWQATPFPLKGQYGPAHFHNDAYAKAAYAHPGQLDPAHPPDLVYLKLADGKMQLLGAMFVAPKGYGAQIGGPLTPWHTHATLCFGSMGAVLTTTPGRCPPGTVFVGDRTEMLHVWVFDNPDGPFAHGLTRQSVRIAIRQLSSGP